jgi:hypothetical protein
VQDLLRVSQNGRLIDGSLTLRGNDQIVEFRPDQPFEAGAIVRFFLNGLLKGNNPADYGNRVQLDRSFTVAGGSARFGLLSVSPTHSADEIPISARPRIRFSARVDPASITPSTVKFSPAYLGTPYAVRVLSDGATVEIVPSQLLAPGAYYSIELTTGIASASGEPFPGTFTHRFTTGAAVETSPPRVRAVSPPDGLSGVPLNAQIRATMSGDLDTTSVRRENIRVHALGRIWPVD